jgi:hypothetical protein
MMTISKLCLNNDILFIVQSFCYYTFKDAHIINQAKTWKKKVNTLILEAMSRNTHDFQEHWGFGYSSDHAERLQLQAESCNLCGNYISLSSGRALISPVLFCTC